MDNVGTQILDGLRHWWNSVIAGFQATAVPEFPLSTLLVLVAIAAVLSIPRFSWRIFGLYVTFVHELGHAFAALMAGRRVHGLKIGLNHSGQLLSSGRPGAGATWSGFWGYPAPAVVGLGMIAAVSYGRAGAAMSVGALLLLLSLIFLRNWTAILVALLSAITAQLLVVFASQMTISWIVLVLGIALSVGAIRDWFKVAGVHTRRRSQLANSDAYILSRSTRVPAGVWLVAFAVVIVAAVGCSAYLIFTRLGA